MAYISVVIPCYNAEEYVDRCMETLVQQTIGIENLEIILVNDASTDNTLEVLKKWEAIYPEQIMVITYEENLRQGGARNIGMQYASADYIGFVDIDDWIETDMYEALWNQVRLGDYDVVRGKLNRESFPGEHPINETEQQDQCYHFEKIQGFYCHEISDTGVNGQYGGIYTGIYKKSIILDNNVWFPEHTAYEDNYWGAILGLYIKDLYIVDRVLYHYFTNMNSTITTRNAPWHFQRLTIELKKLEEYKRLGIFELFHERIEEDFIKSFYLNTLFTFFTHFDYIPDVINDMRRIVKKYFPNYQDNPRIKGCVGPDEALLPLIEIPGDLTEEELQSIKNAYLKTFTYI